MVVIQPGDSFALVLIIGIIFYLIIRRWLPFTLTEWLTQSKRKDQISVPIKGEISKRLQKDGYELISGKVKIPMAIEVDDRSYDSRLYVDYIAKKEGEKYLVFVEHARKPLKLYGPGLRDHFLSFYLLYRPSGILYIKKDQSIHQIDFDIEEYTQPNKAKQLWFYLIFFLLGLIVAWLSS